MIRRPNTRFRKDACVIVAGEHFATRDDVLIETVLGSCVAVCLRDPAAGVAGMNHFMLPDCVDSALAGATKSGRYGAHAMELLINEMMGLGADPRRMQAKVFGGGNVSRTANDSMRVGDWNTDFALNFLDTEGIPVVSRDLGGEHGRRIFFFTREGNVKLRRLGAAEVGTTADRERHYRADIVRELPAAGAAARLTLFD